MGIITLIILGLIVGALAKWIMPGKDPGGLFVTMVLGIAGAMVGGFVVAPNLAWVVSLGLTWSALVWRQAGRYYY